MTSNKYPKLKASVFKQRHTNQLVVANDHAVIGMSLPSE